MKNMNGLRLLLKKLSAMLGVKLAKPVVQVIDRTQDFWSALYPFDVCDIGIQYPSLPLVSPLPSHIHGCSRMHGCPCEATSDLGSQPSCDIEDASTISGRTW